MCQFGVRLEIVYWRLMLDWAGVLGGDLSHPARPGPARSLLDHINIEDASGLPPRPSGPPYKGVALDPTKGP